MKNSANETTAQARKMQVEEHAAELLELIYFVYDKGISALGDVMRAELTRTQSGILWLIRAEGEHGRSLPRKQIAQRLHDWFELSSPAITSALQSMARPPLGLVRLIESADSGREKRVLLTAKGERFVLAMTARGRQVVQELIGDLRHHLSEAQILAGVDFLRLAVAFFQRIHPHRHPPRLHGGNRTRTPASASSGSRAATSPNRAAT